MMCFDPISYDKAEKARKHSENVQEQLNQLKNDFIQHKLDYVEQSETRIKNIITNGNFVDKTGWVANGTDFIVQDNVATFTPVGQYNGLSNYFTSKLKPGHKMYVRITIETEDPDVRLIVNTTGQSPIYADNYAGGVASLVFDVPQDFNYEPTYMRVRTHSTTNFKPINVSKAILIDLTESFDEEPSRTMIEKIIDYIPNQWFDGNMKLRDWQRAYMMYLNERIDMLESTEPPPLFIADTDFATRQTSLLYKKKDSVEWIKANGVAMSVPDTNRIVHTVELDGLTANTDYEFRLPDIEIPNVYLTWRDDPSTTMVIHWHTFKPHLATYGDVYSGEIYKFKTMPTVISNSVKFAHVSDTHGRSLTTQIFQEIGLKDVDCIIHSGDMATGDGGEDPSSWYQFFDSLNYAKDTKGNLIPILPNIGNHEIRFGSPGIQWETVYDVGNKPNFFNKRGDAEWYYCFFPTFPGLQGYGVIDFGNYASVWQLDPGITTFTNKGQNIWLSETLSERVNVPHKIISLHYSPFPLGRRMLIRYYNEIRRDFCPIWEPYKPLVLTGHEHVWGKTVPILGGGLDINDAYEHEDGVVYLSGGPSGAEGREGRNPHTKWWIDQSRASVWEYFDFEKPDYTGMYKEEREPHELDGTTFTNDEVINYWLIELENDKRTMSAFDLNKNLIYSFVQNVS